MPKRISGCSTSPLVLTRKKASGRVLMMYPADEPDPRKRHLTRFAANMPYLIEFSDRAVRDLEFLYIEKNAAESHAAARWYSNLEKAINTLKLRPGRCSLIPEGASAKGTLRHMLYGKKPHVYRVI